MTVRMCTNTTVERERWGKHNWSFIIVKVSPYKGNKQTKKKYGERRISLNRSSNREEETY